MTTIDSTITERGKVYGPYTVNSILAQEIKALLAARPGYHSLLAEERESIGMLVHKLCRVIIGAEHGATPPDRKDSWHDISGYAKLAEDAVGRGNPF